MSSSNLIDKIIFNDILDSNTKAIYRETVEIFNNETFTLDFDGITFNSNLEGVDNVLLLKANIDWGDGSTETIYKRLYSSTSSIGGYETSSWKRITHMYNTDKKNVYLTDDDRALPKITITLYNTFNDCVKIYIPYKLVYKSIYDLGTSFKMLSANISNDNHSSFVMKNKNDDSMMIVGVKNWKKIYGEDDIVYIDDDNVSKDYADLFVNEDSMVWDWDAVPQIALNVKLMSNDSLSWFECDFSEKTVNLDYWKPHCFMMKDEENEVELTDIEVNESLRTFKIYNKKDDLRIPLEIGMFKIYVDLIGVNDVQGISNVQYIKSDETFFADKLEIAYPQFLDFYYLDLNHKDVTFNYTLPNYAFPSHIESASVILTAIRIDNLLYNSSTEWKERYEGGIQQTNQTAEDYINSFTPSDYPLSFLYTLNFSDYNFDLTVSQKNYYTVVPSSSIPNGIYDVLVKVKLKTKTKDDKEETHLYKFEENENGDFIKTTYKIDNLTLNYSDVGNVILSENSPSLSVDKIVIDWQIVLPLELRNVLYRVSKLNEDETINTYVILKNLRYQNYQFTKNLNSYNFTETINPLTIDDGTYRIEVGHVVPMTSYVGQRQLVIGKTLNFAYITPSMELEWVVPYLKKSYSNLVPSFRFSAYLPNGLTVGGVDFNYTFDLESLSFSHGLKLTNDISWVELNRADTFNFNVKAYNVKDNIFKRKQKNPKTYKIEKIKDVPLGLATIQFNNLNATSSVTYIKLGEVELEIVGSSLIRNTNYNLPKKYKWVDKLDSSKVYYSYDDKPFYFAVDGKPLATLFSLEKYCLKFNRNKKITRYLPVTSVVANYDTVTETIENLNCIQLPSVKLFLDKKQITASYTYNKLTDRCDLTIGSNLALWEEDVSLIHDAILTLKSKNEIVYSSNLRNDFYITIGSLDVGKYLLDVLFHSSNVDNTKDYVYTLTHKELESLNMLIKDTDVMDYSHYVSTGNNNISKYLTINWSLYHKHLSLINLYTKVLRHYLYEWLAWEIDYVKDLLGNIVKDLYGNPIPKYIEKILYLIDETTGDYKLDEYGLKIPKRDENGQVIIVYLTDSEGNFILDANGNKVPVYLTFAGTPIKVPQWLPDKNGLPIPIYELDENGKLLKDEEGNPIRKIIILKQDVIILDTKVNVPHGANQNTLNQYHQLPIALKSTDEVLYYFKLLGDTIDWSIENPNHTLPFLPVKLTIL